MSTEQGMFLAFSEGSVSIPGLLLKHYAELGLTETEMMLVLHLVVFREKDHKDFPTIEEIQSRMSAAPEQVIEAIQKLLSEGWITIDDEVDPQSGIHYERYNLSGVYRKLAEHCAGRNDTANAGAVHTASSSAATAAADQSAAGMEAELDDDGMDMNLFVMFEQEFGRPLSPMECESIVSWLDKDGYSEELIIAALKESVFAGKVHFKYIDRILLEWVRNSVRTPEEAKEYALRYRGQ